MKKLFLTLLIFLPLIFVYAGDNDKPGKIYGKVLDGSNGGVLPDAIIKIETLNKGTASDLDGSYTIDNVTAGTHIIKFAYVGYTEKKFNVEIMPGELVNLDAVLIPEYSINDTVLIEADRIKNSDSYILTKQQKSDGILDGIGELQIKRSPVAQASDVLKRVIGVTIVKDKFVYVRGTSERYNNTTINGALLPSTESDKKAFSFDLFPSNLIENILISKSFTPDQPGNNSGGLVQITTKEFPEKFTMSYSITGSYNTNTTGKKFLSYNSSEKEFLSINLGIDKSRNLPEIIPQMPLKNNNFTRDQLTDFSRAFSNNWSQTSKSAPINSGFQLSAGNVFNLFKMPVGILAAYSYRNGFSNKDVERNEYNTDNTQLSGYKGSSSEYSVLWGALFNLNMKINNNNKIGFKSTYTLSSEDETENYKGFFIPEGVERKLYLTKFTQRNLLSGQISGEHLIKPLANVKIQWNASYSESQRKEPDVKTMTYQRERNGEDTTYFAPLMYNSGNTYVGGRFFSELRDINRSFSINSEIPFKLKIPFIETVSNGHFKFGGLINGLKRTFSARNFGPALYIGAPFTLIYQPIDSIFNPQNFDNNKLFYDEVTKDGDKYNAYENLYSTYAMFDIPLKNLRLVFGARFEYNEQFVGSVDVIGDPVTRYLKNIDILPSLNLTYSLTEKINIRGAYSQTLSRPELREIAPFSYLDFVSGNLVYGNSTDLRRTLVRNYDLRFEYYPNPGEIISASLFYKKFDAPIEEVFLPTSTNKLKTFKNAENGANNYGVEIEFRKNLGFIGKFLSNFSLNANVAFIQSKINLEGSGTTATKLERRMQGQSPYTYNIGLYYDNYKTGTGVNLSYNKFGERISEVGLNGYNDIREIPRDQIDITISQKLFNKFELKLSAKDILNQDQTFKQIVNGTDETVRLYKTGTNYSFTLSYKY